MSHLLLCGNAYAQIVRDARNQVLTMYPLVPNKITVNRADNGEIYYYIYTKNNKDRKGYNQVLLRDYEVLHILGLGFDGLIGYSPIAMAKNAVGTKYINTGNAHKIAVIEEDMNFQSIGIPPYMIGDLDRSNFSI